MRLSRLLREERETILQEFEDFARSHTAPGASMDVVGLRDHASLMLDAIVIDLEQPQSDAEQERKSKGEGPVLRSATATAAQEHGVARARSGFSMVEAMAEYRALRASVVRHWIAKPSTERESEIQDLIRFNEALDQAIAESTDEYSKAIGSYREMFLAMLGHDLRSPLDAVMNASSFLAENAELPERDLKLVRTIRGSAGRMGDLIADMMDFTSSQLGQGIPLRPGEGDLGEIVEEAVREGRMAHPGRDFRLDLGEGLTGEWDARRIRQAISNLLNNAVQHGAPDSTITTSVSGGPEDDLIVEVHNHGPEIPPRDQEQIFEPYRRGSANREDEEHLYRGVGLGLYIARQVAEAHGGGLYVRSCSQDGTRFSLQLPRTPTYDAGRHPE